MVYKAAVPNFALIGQSTRPECLIVGVYENSIRRVIDLPVNSGSTAVAYKRGQILFRDRLGVLTPFTVTQVTDEAVGTGDGSDTTFTLDHIPMVGSSLVVKVAGTLSLAYTFDDTTGVITFTAAPALSAAITASYQYMSHQVTDFPDKIPMILEWDVDVPAKVGSVNGSATASVVLKGEIASDQLLVGSTPWADLSKDVKVTLENILTVAGLVPGTVIR